jgi:hypothetical protein
VVTSPYLTVTSSGTNAGLVTESGNPGPGSYTVSGTTADSLGDTGNWTFTLTVTGPGNGQVPESPSVPLLPLAAAGLAGAGLIAFGARRRTASTR